MNTYKTDYSQYENQYKFNYYQHKKFLNKKNNFFCLIIVLLIVLLLGLCIFLKPHKSKINEFYFVEIDNFQTYKKALNLSEELQNLACKSYIYFDDKYHVLVSFYSNKNDAEKVCENLKNDYPKSQVICLTFSQFQTHKNLTTKQNSSIENSIISSQKLLQKLEQIYIDFSTQKITFEKAQILLKENHNYFTSALSDFMSNFKADSQYNLSKTYINNIDKSLFITTQTNEQDFSLSLRFEIMSIAISLTQFVNSL